jgi:Zn-dependent membrane protease YugP
VWWRLLLLLAVPTVARIFAHVWYVHTRHRLDHATPDDLPQTAGEWLKAKLVALGLSDRVRVVVTSEEKHSRDRFHVRRGVIQLTEETYFKRDPAFWATAAHELGHARYRLRFPLSTPLELEAGFIEAMLLKLALGLAAGNVLLAIPLATQLAHAMFIVAFALHAYEVAEEAIASGIGLSMLRAELSTEQLRAARQKLTAAFLTYFLPWLAYGLLLTQWWIVERLTAVPRVPSGGVTTLGLVVAAIASAYLVLFGLMQVFAAVRAPRLLAAVPWPLELAWKACVVTMIALGWDRHAGGYGWAVLLAFSELSVLVRLVVELPSDIATMPLKTWALRRDPGIELSAVYRAAREAGLVDTQHGNRWVAGVMAEIGSEVGPIRRLWEINRLLVFPLVCLFWL